MGNDAVGAYRQCRFVVTTRPQAYEDRVVKLPGFDEVRIAALDAETIEASLQRWSGALFSESAESARQHSAELVQALRERPEILDGRVLTDEPA